MDLAGRGPDGRPGVQGPAAARAGGGIVVPGAVRDLGARKRAAPVTPLSARLPGTLPPAGLPPLTRLLRRRLRQPVARRRLAAAGTVGPRRRSSSATRPDWAATVARSPAITASRSARAAVRSETRLANDPGSSIVPDTGCLPALSAACHRGFSRLGWRAYGRSGAHCQAECRRITIVGRERT